ncbi:rhodanese-like domain-containing protein [Enterococcus hermanniensis]|uniref:Rhodanese domain-containing protein n=1 Tax=Enterococcus hermanniensis TaxID=249189 RepID=A0A1L8TRD2_9ENTE|nr:rhodanese-like domain-containing protein [Enterococcus hermanniensis]OJG46875.1 hypothetical protein RV04_GL000122 [Enterococcus hermanniensis]
MNNSLTAKEFAALAAKETVNVLDLSDADIFDTLDTIEHATVLQLPLTQLPNRLHQLDKDKTYYLFTQFGQRAKTMAQHLRNEGFNVIRITGGTSAYKQYLAS